jgi:hypothetical protein
MRKVLATAALVAMTGAAQAQTVATQAVSLGATVNGYCTIDGGSTGTVRSATVTTANGKVANPGSLTVGGASGNVICTSNAKIQLTTAAGGLTNGPTPTDTNYTNKIHYTMTATYNGKTETLTTTDATTPGTTTTGTDTVGGAQTNVPLALSLSIAATPTGKFLVNGTFNDTVTVTLTPVP